MKKKNLILILIIVFTALLILSSCTIHDKVMIIVQVRLRSEDGAIDVPLAGLTFYVQNSEYITDENGFASVYVKSIDDADAYSTNLCDFPAQYIPNPDVLVEHIYNTIFVTYYLEINDNYLQPPPGTDVPDNSLISKKLSYSPVRIKDDNYSGEIRGYIMDTDYNRLAGVDVYFGEEAVYAGKTNAAGEFSLFFKNAYQYENEKVIDFLYFVHDDYKFKAFLKSESYHKDIEVFVVATRKDSGYDLDADVAPVFIRCCFDHRSAEVTLPPGYNRNEKAKISEEARDTIVGVEIYLKGKLVSVSDQVGFNIDFLVPNTQIEVKKEGYRFTLRYDLVFTPIENNSYFWGSDEKGFLLEFRGIAENKD